MSDGLRDTSSDPCVWPTPGNRIDDTAAPKEKATNDDLGPKNRTRRVPLEEISTPIYAPKRIVDAALQASSVKKTS